MSVALVPTPNPCFRVLEIKNIVDGDTLEVVLDKWHGETRKLRVRLLEVDCPERKDKEPWKAATFFTYEWCWRAFSAGTMNVEGHRFDSFGRLLAWVWDEATAEGLNHQLVVNGHGKSVPLHVHLRELGAVI